MTESEVVTITIWHNGNERAQHAVREALRAIDNSPVLSAVVRYESTR